MFLVFTHRSGDQVDLYASTVPVFRSQTEQLGGESRLEERAGWRREQPGGESSLEERAAWRREQAGGESRLLDAHLGGQRPGRSENRSPTPLLEA